MSLLADALFETIPNAAFLVEPETTRLLQWNEDALALLGFEAEDFAHTTLRELHPAEDREGICAYFAAPPPPGQQAGLICRLTAQWGEVLPCELYLTVAEHGGQKVLLAIYRNLTARLQAKEDINLRNIAIASVQSGVSIADARQPDLPLIYVNEGFVRITGYSQKEAVGRSCRFLQGDDRDQPDLKTLRQALNAGEACDVRLRNYRKDGRLFWNELHISPVHSAEGELTHFIGIQLDVTERVEARERLKASEVRYRTLAENVRDLILRCTPDGIFDYVSPASQAILGYEPEELQALPRRSLIHPEDWLEVADRTKKLLGGQSPQTFTARWRAASGKWCWLEFTDSLVDLPEAEEQRRIVSVARDVTARKKADEEVKQALAHERETNEMKTRFIRTVSHEFRTPMTGVSASSEFLHEFYDKLTPAKRERHWQNIQRSLGRMNAILDDVLFLSRTEATRARFEPQPVDVTTWLTDYVDDLRLLHGDNRLAMTAELETGTSFAVDADLLERILSNLLSNALKYSAEDTTVRLRIAQEADTLVFTVQDTGIGIPAADQTLLFEAFHRAGNVGNRSGTGLGLNITRRAVELHGGSVTFHSQEDEGTTFTVRLHAPRMSLPAREST